jgi:2-methylcitrate dehydratase PrpD
MLTQPLSQRLRPRTTIDAKFSVPFATALALVRGQPTLSDFTAQTIRDPQVLEMASRISVHILTSTTRPPGWGRLEATLRDGRRIEGEVDYALGHPSKPLDWPALETKFRRCAEHAQFRSTEMAEQILAAISQLEQCMDTGIALFGGR